MFRKEVRLSYIRAKHERYIIDTICSKATRYTASPWESSTNIISYNPQGYISHLLLQIYRCETCLTISLIGFIIEIGAFKSM